MIGFLKCVCNLNYCNDNYNNLFQNLSIRKMLCYFENIIYKLSNSSDVLLFNDLVLTMSFFDNDVARFF